MLLRVLTGSEGVCAGKVEVIHYTNVFYPFVTPYNPPGN